MNKNRIEELRKKNDLSVNQLAKMIGVSRTTLYNYEIGKSSVPSIILIKLRQVFKVSVDYILYQEPIDDYVSLNVNEVDELLSEVKKNLLKKSNKN